MQNETEHRGLPASVLPLAEDDPGAVGPYPLLGRLGEGGMGVVYLGRAPDARHVAIKVVRPELAADDGYRERFRGEVAHARRVASFCTAAVLDHGEAGGLPYLVTEYVAGTSLARQIRRHGALPPGTLHGVALGVAAALAAIHGAGLVHRDLKPANVILSLSGPRVIDFGIARAVLDPTSDTRSGLVMGSPGWIAPEQVKRGEVSPAGDVFAWGCLVAYAGLARHPFVEGGPNGANDLMVLTYRAENRMHDLAGLDEPLRALVERALSPDPRARPTARQLLMALVGGPESEAGSGPPPGVLPAGGPAHDAVLEAASQSIDRHWRPEELPLWTPPSDPLPPPSQPNPVVVPPARSPVRRRLVLVALGVLGAAVAGLVYQERTAPAEGQFGRASRDGDFVFEASPPECDREVPGVTAADGRLCQVRFTVTNTGLSARPLDPADQRLRGRADAAEQAAALFEGTAPTAKGRIAAPTIPAGTSFTGVLVWDVPPGFAPEDVELRMTATSRGVRLPVTQR